MGKQTISIPTKTSQSLYRRTFFEDWLKNDSRSIPSQGPMQAVNEVTQKGKQCDPATETIVEQLIRENQDLIEKEALKQAAAATLNVSTAQYSNLIPLSFDQEELIRLEEEKRMKQREKLKNTLHLKN
ncbi:hypothetical protein DICVIV_05528 [Dictyocaulus viviparus]|uniref:Uncharacterized protein n=1 Tax=Dictyocaulus viviparus TaxID=29172 RepID=A0A0D8XX12_DICVI|nr:hypothetical protein DICVIV_05528 [Dictyocaulus viviparus]